MHPSNSEKDTKERAQTMMPDYAKSFVIGGQKKFVNITLGDVEIKGK